MGRPMKVKGAKKVRTFTRSKDSKTPRVLYFGPATQEAIEQYQSSPDRMNQEVLYVQGILPAFDKLVENLIFMYGFAKSHDSYEVLKNDCISFLYEQLHKFDPERGTKAFSYFNVVARNWLIIKTKQRQKTDRRHVSIDDHESLSARYKAMIESHQVVPAQDEIMIARARKDEILNLLHAIKGRLTNDNEIACIDAITILFAKVDELEFLNKRALFVYIRDLSNLSPKQVSTAMSVIRRHYKDLTQSEEFRLF